MSLIPQQQRRRGEKWLNIKPRILFRRGSRVWTTPTRRAVSHPMGEEWLRGRGRWQLQAVSCVTKEGGERVGSSGTRLQDRRRLRCERSNLHCISIVLPKDPGLCCPSLGGGQKQPTSFHKGLPRREWQACPRSPWPLEAEGAKETPREDLEPKRI